MDKVNWKIGGEAGKGIISSGVIFSRLLLKAGFEVFGYQEYPSLIRGGHNTFHVSANKKSCLSPQFPLDVLVALNEETISTNSKELSADGILIYNSNKINLIFNNSNYLPFPLSEITEKSGGDELMANSVAIGASSCCLGVGKELLSEAILSVFGKKGSELGEKNVKAALLGFDEFEKKYPDKKLPLSISPHDRKKFVLTGNEALSLGCIKGQCQFSAIYPMTPTTNILHYLINNREKLKMIVHQAEDEISAVNMAIGAAFSGLRSMTATSGGGFDLMTETLSLSGITETPLVIILGQRGGPSTGLPTWTSQGDLEAALYSGHGEFPRIIFSPGNAQEAIDQTAEAFNLADKYQVPVIILVDKHICESIFTCDNTQIKNNNIDRGKILLNTTSDPAYKRYLLTQDGISPRAIPGLKDVVVRANSYEHTESGFAVEDSETIIKMQKKRALKATEIAQLMPNPTVYGKHESRITIVAWGSNFGVINDSLEFLRTQGINVKFLHINTVWPFPASFVRNVLEESENVIIFENNKTMQLAKLIRQQTGIDIKNKVSKYDGRPFLLSEIIDEVKKITV